MDSLFTRPTADAVVNPFVILSAIVFAVGLIAAGYLSSQPGKLLERHTRVFVRRATTIIGWMCGIGLFFVVVRLLGIDPLTFGRGIWILLSWLALIGALAVLVAQMPADRKVKEEHRQQSRNRAKARPVRHKRSLR